jgi:hypothetical protein
MSHEHTGATFVASSVTGLIVAIPESVLTYGGKVLSVFFLAMIAEFGRRLVNRLWKSRETK